MGKQEVGDCVFYTPEVDRKCNLGNTAKKKANFQVEYFIYGTNYTIIYIYNLLLSVALNDAE